MPGGAGISATRREIFFFAQRVDKSAGVSYNRGKEGNVTFSNITLYVSRGGYMAKKKTASLFGLILMLVAVVGAVLAAIGVFTDWVKYVVDSVVGGGSEGSTLKELADYSEQLEMYGAMNVFAYITMILSIVSAALLVLVKFLKMGILRPITGLAGLLTVVSVILMIVFTIMFCSKNAEFSFGDWVSGKYTWAVGAILASIGGVLAGVSAVLGYKKN